VTVPYLILLACTSLGSDGCSLIAEISVEAVCEGGAIAVCATSASPIACEVAVLCEAVGPAGKELTKQAIAEACTVLVQRVGPEFRILIEGPKDRSDVVKRAYQTLDKAPGIKWRERKLP
jgi:hypothetical protein